MKAISPSTQKALNHLRKIKEYDGWKVETNTTTKEVRLLRRNVPLTTNYFRDIHYDTATGNTVGMLTQTKAQILVDDQGKPVGKTPVVIQVRSYGSSSSTSTRRSSRTNTSATTSRSRGSTTARGNSTTAAADSENMLSDEQNQKLLKYAVYVVGILVSLKAFLSFFYSLYLIVLPLGFIYAMTTCPKPESFDARKEIKRVLRGHHLPEDHPDKPRGWLAETMSRVQASVTTELATGLGYEVSMTNLGGAAILAQVNVPSVNRGYFWLGIFNKWYYVYCMELDAAAEMQATG